MMLLVLLLYYIFETEIYIINILGLCVGVVVGFNVGLYIVGLLDGFWVFLVSGTALAMVASGMTILKKMPKTPSQVLEMNK